MTTAKDNIVIVDQSVLFSDKESVFYGFRRVESNGVDYRSRILDNIPTFKTKIVSNDQLGDFPDFKQIFACSFILNPDKHLISVYNTVPVNKVNTVKSIFDVDSRGYWSAGYKTSLGSIDKTAKDPLVKSILDNLREEVRMDGDMLGVKFLGYMHESTSNKQGRFLLVYALRTNATRVEKKDAGYSKMANIADLRKSISLSDKHDIPSRFDLSTKRVFPSLDNLVGHFNSRGHHEW